MREAVGSTWWGWAACAALFAVAGAEAGPLAYLLMLLAPLGLATTIAWLATRRGRYPAWLTPVVAWVLGAGPWIAALVGGRGAPPGAGHDLAIALAMHRGPIAIFFDDRVAATPVAVVVVPCLAIGVLGLVLWSVRRPGPGWVAALAPSLFLWCTWGLAVAAIGA